MFPPAVAVEIVCRTAETGRAFGASGLASPSVCEADGATHEEDPHMTTPETGTRAQHVRDAIRTLATARARTTRLEHGVQSTADVVRAKTKEAAARAGTTAAEMKRGAQKRLDDAVVDAVKGKGKNK